MLDIPKNTGLQGKYLFRFSNFGYSPLLRVTKDSQLLFYTKPTTEGPLNVLTLVLIDSFNPFKIQIFRYSHN